MKNVKDLLTSIIGNNIGKDLMVSESKFVSVSGNNVDGDLKIEKFDTCDEFGNTVNGSNSGCT